MTHRKRQIRLFTIQRLIMERVGFERGAPNVTSSARRPRLSAERLRATINRHRAAEHLPADYLAHRVITLLPACKAKTILK